MFHCTIVCGKKWPFVCIIIRSVSVKDHFRIEKYWSSNKFQYRQIMTKFRISAHSLRIESGRYERKENKENKLIKIVREERIYVFDFTVIIMM